MRVLPVAVLLGLLVAGCSSRHPTAKTGTGTIAVNAGSKSCQVGATSLPAGRHTFEVTNNASEVTEVYVYAPAIGSSARWRTSAHRPNGT